ncbi:Antigenic thaumatin-like protein [Colletotrichum siamense]|nr:Antigenic thaumatin-like protein [Colletotrichum siamense]WJV41809.1 antigenic thaumatin-like protein [Colletotrichum siamense]
MQLPSLLLPLTLALSANALGRAVVVNRCPTEVTLWSVGGSVSAANTLSPNGGSYGETFVRDATTGGKSLKVTNARDGLYTGAAQLNFAYNLDGSQVWYDLSTVFGDAFAGKKITVKGKAGCGEIVWASGTNPGGSQVKVCGSDGDVTLTLCAA